MKTIVRYLIHRPLQVHLIVIFIVILAIASLGRIQRVGLPLVDMGEVRIMTVYPGASPEDVELNVTRKIEEALQEVQGIEEFRSESMENLSTIIVRLDPESDFEEVQDDIRRAVDRVGDLPEEVTEDPIIVVLDTADMTIYEIGLVLTNDQDIHSIKPLAERLKEDLKNLDVVSRVEENGVPETEIQILLNKEAMQQKYISFGEVIRAIQANKVRISGGSLESYTSSLGIVTLSDFQDVKDIENLIITSNDVGDQIRIRDIATVRYGPEEQDEVVRMEGHPGMYYGIAIKRGSDMLDAVEKIEEAVERFSRLHPLPGGVELIELRDESIETRLRLSIVIQNAVAGFVLVMLILFLFFNRRIALWTAFGIPIAVAVALIGIPFLDVTLNRISLLGLIVVLGMLVDDSIIVAESIFRERQSGKDPEEAAVDGLSRVLRPVIATVLTTVLAFIPLYFLGGPVGDFSVEIPTVVILMLAGSLLEAVLLLPAHLGHAEKSRAVHTPDEKGQAPRAKGQISEPIGARWIQQLENRYISILEKALKKRMATGGILLLALIVSLGIGLLLVRFEMFPVDQAWRMWIYGETAEDSNLQATVRETEKLEQIVRELPEGVVHSYRTTAGRTWTGTQVLPNIFITEIIFTPSTERDMTAEMAREEIFQKVGERDIAFRKLDYYLDGGGPPAGKPIELELIGNDNQRRIQLLQSLVEDLKKMGLTDVSSNYAEGKPELRLVPDHSRIARAGLDVARIAMVIRTAFDGTIAAYLDTNEDRIPYRVILSRQSQSFEDPLSGLQVRNDTGRLVPLERLVKTERVLSPQTIYHYNGKRSNQITANLDREKFTPAEVYETLAKKYGDFSSRHPGFRLELGGEAAESSDALGDMVVAILVAVAGIYFILVIQFNSFLQPAMVILAIPFGLAGILLSFAIHGIDLSMLALIGIIGFAGVVVNDSLIMVDYVNRLKSEDENADLHQGIVDGARLRLRPILLTTLTTVAGLLPTAYGLFGGFDSFIAPLVLAMAWGLLIGTPSVLFVIPVLYSLIDDVEQKLILMWRRGRGALLR